MQGLDQMGRAIQLPSDEWMRRWKARGGRLVAEYAELLFDHEQLELEREREHASKEPSDG